jgi:hypothetical protein
MLTLPRAIATAALVLPTCWLIACASGDAGTGSGGSDFSGKSDAAPPKKTDGGTEAAAPKPSAATCGATKDSDSCFQCCVPNGSDPFAVSSKAVDGCVQKAAQKCGAACVASVTVVDGGTGDDAVSDGAQVDPNAPEPSDPCAACESDFDICDDLAANACNTDPNCAAAQKCLTDSKCDSKPSVNDGGVSSDNASDYATPAPVPSGG